MRVEVVLLCLQAGVGHGGFYEVRLLVCVDVAEVITETGDMESEIEGAA